MSIVANVQSSIECQVSDAVTGLRALICLFRSAMCVKAMFVLAAVRGNPGRWVISMLCMLLHCGSIISPAPSSQYQDSDDCPIR